MRGRATPIVDLAAVLGEEVRKQPARLVTARTGGGRSVGLLVDEVLGLRAAHEVDPGALPSLLADAAVVVDQLARLDGQLLTVLRAGTLLPDDVCARVSEDGSDLP